jgi:hypothetical protein
MHIGQLLGGQVITPSGPAVNTRVANSIADPTAWVVPDGIEGVLAVTADNSLVVRGTPEGIRSLTDLLTLIDVPQRQTTLVLNAGSLRAETVLGDNEEGQLLDSEGSGRLEAKVTLKRSASGMVVSVDGQLRINGQSRSFRTQRTLVPGLAVAIASVKGGKGPVTLYVKASSSSPTPGGFGSGGLDGGRRF